MPPDIRHKAAQCGCTFTLTEDLLDLPYLARLWFVTADIPSGKQKMGWLINHYKRLKDAQYLRPAMLDELWTQVQLGYIPANRVGDIFAGLDGKKTIGQIAYELGLYQTNDVRSIAEQAVRNNPKAVGDYLSGETKALGAILGAMRAAGVNDMPVAKQVVEELLKAVSRKPSARRVK